MIELLGLLALLLGVAGVLLNNRQDIRCFYVWAVGTVISLGLHVWACWQGQPMVMLAARDALFLALTADGFRRWRRTPKP